MFLDVKAFGAKGDGSAASAAINSAIAASIDEGKTLWMSPGVYGIDGPIELLPNLDLRGSVWETKLRKLGHGPTFIAPPYEADFISVGGFNVDYDSVGGAAEDDVAFAFVNPGACLSNLDLHDVYVLLAHTAIKDTVGGWMSRISRVWARECVNGFWKEGGTTTIFENCFANNGTGKGWYLYGTISCQLHGCALGRYRSRLPFHASAVRGLEIAGFDAESNIVEGEDGHLFRFDRCSGLVVNNVTTLMNELRTAKGSGSYLMTFDGGDGALNGLVLGGGKDDPALNDTVSGPGAASSAVIFVGSNPRYSINGGSINPCDADGYAGGRYSIAAISDGSIVLSGVKYKVGTIANPGKRIVDASGVKP